ncbi:hypothetical protein PIB30_030633 [Stylosanthes scabra]|uniref:Aminotransferase-like plant mobile domain-containing protein n=1 Tax=Stylosanthes scabra TaxID=79078 RepID=A0ABU6Y8T6_9FABA|nr:hypothetical protein [Stylosanthes scabra]
MEMSGCLPLVLSWIYQRFPRFCPPGRNVMGFSLVSRLNGLALTTRDTHGRRQLEFRNELDRVGVDDVRIPKLFVWTPYMTPQWRAIEPAWVHEAAEIQTWLATVPIVPFMYVRFRHIDRVKGQFGGEQPVPLHPVNLDGFRGARGDDRWEYTQWWAVACRQRFLTQDRLLQDPRGFQLLGDVPPAASQERDPIVLPRDAPARGDIWQKGEGVPSSGREDPQSSGDDEDEEAEYARQENIPERGGDEDLGGHDPVPHEPDLDFFSGADVDLAWFMEYGGGSRSQPGEGGPPSHRYGPPSDMYELFSCGEQTMDQIAHGYVTSRPTDDAVYRPSPPMQPHPDHSQPCQGFQYYQPSSQSFLRTSPQQQYQLPSPHCQTYYQPSPQPSYPSPSWAQPHY